MVDKNKRGLMFSVVSVILLILVLILSSSIVSYSKHTNTLIVEDIIIQKEGLLRSNILIGKLRILNVEVPTITLDSQNLTYNFLKLSIINSTPYDSTQLSSYETFIEGNYSSLINSNITLTNFDHKFRISPFGTEFEITPNRYIVRTKNYTNISKISLVINVSGYLDTQYTIPSFSGSDMVLDVILVNKTDYIGIFGMGVNSTESGTFRYNLINDSGQINVSYGDILGADGTLVVETSLSEVEVQNFSISYDCPSYLTLDKTGINVGNVVIS